MPAVAIPDLNDLRSETSRAAFRELADSSLYYFTKAVLHRDYLRKSPHGAVCQHLQDCYRNRRWCELIQPRGFLKSTIATEALPIWAGAQDPEQTFLIVMNTQPNAQKQLAVIRREWESNEILRGLYPEVVPDTDKVTWHTNAACLKRKTIGLSEATYECAGVRSSLASRHYMNIIGDDLIAATENPETGEEYEPTREDIAVACTWLNRMPPLLQNPRDGWFSNVGTRWCEDDTFAHTSNWNMARHQVDSLDADGNPTFDMYTLDVLEQREKMLGPYLFSALYRNKPMSAKDRTFHREWIQHPKFDLQKPDGDESKRYFMAIDPASTQTRTSDYTAIVVVGVDERGWWYVVDYINERLGNKPDEVAFRATALIKRWKVRRVAVETTHWHGQLRDIMREMIASADLRVGVEEIKSSIANRKDDRILALEPLFAAKKVFIRRNMPELEAQLMNYRPGGNMPHDDLIDALGMVKFVASPARVAPKEKVLSPFSGKAILRDLDGMGAGKKGDGYYAVTGQHRTVAV